MDTSRVLLPLLLALAPLGCAKTTPPPHAPQPLEHIVVAPDGRGFITADSRRPFRPWGMNYGNAGRLMEDFWDADWQTFADDFQEMRALGANIVRVHLQYGKFMRAPDQPDPEAFEQLRRMLRLAEETPIYLDITGLACYRPADCPAWYDAMDEKARWDAQARFWAEVAKTCAHSPAVFCYDLMNEPVSPAKKRDPGQWRSGKLLGQYDFVQAIALDPVGRKREDIAVAWIRHLTAAIRRHDDRHLITVGCLPWSQKWKFLSGFLPEKIAPELDFLSVHIYPKKDAPDEAMECLRHFAVGKPVVIEETFPLSCGPDRLKEFLLASREIACGWIGHYDGSPPDELDALKRDGKITMPQAVYRSWQKLFVELGPEMLD